jgi:hypothetical protein
LEAVEAVSNSIRCLRKTMTSVSRKLVSSFFVSESSKPLAHTKGNGNSRLCSHIVSAILKHMILAINMYHTTHTKAPNALQSLARKIPPRMPSPSAKSFCNCTATSTVRDLEGSVMGLVQVHLVRNEEVRHSQSQT